VTLEIRASPNIAHADAAHSAERSSA
jgi:hypothetical protein